MRRRTLAISLVATAAIAVGGGVLTALPSGAATATTYSVPSDAVWKDSGQWATWTSGDYTLYNDVWGSGAGTQTIWARSTSNWGVEANNPRTSGIKSYPNISRTLNRTVSSLGTLSGSFHVTVTYSELHLPGAVNIPLKELDADTTSGLDRANPVVVYCWDYI